MRIEECCGGGFVLCGVLTHQQILECGENDIFCNLSRDNVKYWETLDEFGLPEVGTRLVDGDLFYGTLSGPSGTPTPHKHKGEECYVDSVRVTGAYWSSEGAVASFGVPRLSIVGKGR